MRARAKLYYSDLSRRFASIPNKFSIYFNKLGHNYSIWFIVHENRIADFNQPKKVNNIDHAFPNSFIYQLRRAFGFTYGEDDALHQELSRGFIAEPEDKDVSEIINIEWLRFLNPFHMVAFTWGFTKSLLIGIIDGLDRVPCCPCCQNTCCSCCAIEGAGSFEFAKSSTLAKSLKGTIYVASGIVDPLLFIFCKIPGDILDFVVLDRLSDFVNLIGECCCGCECGVDPKMKALVMAEINTNHTVIAMSPAETADDKKAPDDHDQKPVMPVRPASAQAVSSVQMLQRMHSASHSVVRPRSAHLEQADAEPGIPHPTRKEQLRQSFAYSRARHRAGLPSVTIPHHGRGLSRTLTMLSVEEKKKLHQDFHAAQQSQPLTVTVMTVGSSPSDSQTPSPNPNSSPSGVTSSPSPIWQRHANDQKLGGNGNGHLTVPVAAIPGSVNNGSSDDTTKRVNFAAS
jgi:hypothetical protein